MTINVHLSFFDYVFDDLVIFGRGCMKYSMTDVRCDVTWVDIMCVVG